MSFANLRTFRQDLYLQLGHSKDALFDLMDALLTTSKASSFVQISLSPLFRRQWSSAFKAVEDFCLSSQPIMVWLLGFLSLSESPQVVVLDHTSWPRLWSLSLKDRTYEHQASVLGGKPPVTLGQGYSTLGLVPEAQGSWLLPLRHERITSFETAVSRGIFQLKRLCRQLKTRVVVLADSEYATAPMLKGLDGLDLDKLMRLRPNRVLRGAPPPYSGRGRPRIHGERLALRHCPDWAQTPAQEDCLLDPQRGRVRLRRWTNVHFQQAAHLPFDLICVEMLETSATGCLWLLWQGQTPWTLEQLWHLYERRFTIEHWYRFLKQRLHWTLPQWGTPQQAERWSCLMLLLTWQLWLARPEVSGRGLPWQKPQAQPSPGRVAQDFSAVLATIGSPAPEPKPRGKGRGCPLGEARRTKRRFPSVKRRAKSRPKVA
ncbi:MAG: transposase [Aquiluna sp.]